MSKKKVIKGPEELEKDRACYAITKEALIQYSREVPTLSQDSRGRLDDLIRNQLQTGIFCAIRLLEQTGKEVDITTVTQILEVSKLDINKPQIQAALEDYHTKQQLLIERLKKQKKTYQYETLDGMLLTLTQNGDGYKIDLKEDLSVGEPKQNFRNLFKRLRTAVGDVEVISADYVLGKGGEETGLVAKLRLSEIKKLSSREEELLESQQLYKHLAETLQQRIQNVEKLKRADPKSLVDDIEHFTHLRIGNLYKQIESLIPTTYFLRELYGIVQARTNITLQQIQSDEKTRTIAENRHAMMYIARHRFPTLSSSELGIVFGTPTKPKNHATVLIAQDSFDKNIGLDIERYTDRRFVAGTLYDDAVKKRLTYLRKYPSRFGPNPSFEEVFVMK